MQHQLFSPYPAAADEVCAPLSASRHVAARTRVRWGLGVAAPRSLTPALPPVQFRLAQEAGPETFAQHRDTWITKRELQEMKDLNVNCIRLPFGYWVLDLPELVRKPAGPHHPARARPATPVYEWRPPPRATPRHPSNATSTLAGPYEGERAWIRRARPYDGPAEDHITRVLDDCREVGLAVILCLHGAPGGQSGHHACGFEDDDWTPEMWDVPESVRCIEHMAVTWGHHPAMFGITVLNEASVRARTHTRPPSRNGRRPPTPRLSIPAAGPTPSPAPAAAF